MISINSISIYLNNSRNHVTIERTIEIKMWINHNAIEFSGDLKKEQTKGRI